MHSGTSRVMACANVPHCQGKMFHAAPDGLRNGTEADWIPSKPMPSTLREEFMSQRNGDKAR
ncbi:MAG TPA: hypothetical protein VFS12_00975, partial [Terriglobia bacterium]|nr:hypothetical protein [Terriglobia bacterium]